MPVRQGGKIYAQVLLDVHRYELLERLAQARNVRVTQLIRELTYDYLAAAAPTSEYKAAEKADQALWAEAVRRRVQGRQRQGA